MSTRSWASSTATPTGSSLESAPTGWKHLGNGVVALALARPPWLSEGSPYCVEMLHEPATLRRTDEEGRRLFLRAEFGISGVSADKRFRMRFPQKTTLVIEDVDRVADGKSVGLGKVAFAQAIHGRTSPYSYVDFTGFRPTLERLWEAVAVAQTACS